MPAVVDGSELRNANAIPTQGGRSDDYEINFALKKAGADKFGAWTGSHINEYMDVLLNDEVKSIANGKVGTGEQAQSMKLIDTVGDFEAAVADTAKSVGISGEPTLVRTEKDRKTLLDLLTGDVSKYIPTREKLMEQQVGFYYLWK